MAIIKMQRVKTSKPYGLKAVLDYIQNPDKTENGSLISAKDCLLESAYEQMYMVKQEYQQMKGRQYVHIIQSFSLSDDLTGEMANEIGQKLMASFDGFQGVVATHTDRQHIHNHIVLNSVNYKTGLKWQQSKKDLQLLKDKSDQLCHDYGLSVIEKGKGWKSYGENRANYSGVSWKRRLAETVAESIGRSNTREEFIHYLKDEGIEANFLSNKVLFILEDGKKCGSDRLLSYGDFTKENMNNVIQYNDLTFRAALNNPRLMYEAVQLASDLLDYEDKSDLERRYLHHIPLSALEGEALKKAICELKKGGAYTPNKTKPDNQKSNKNPYLLMTIETGLEVLLEEKSHERQYERLRQRYIDEEELEM